MPIHDEVTAYYTRYHEAERLQGDGFSQVEFARTQEIMRRYLPAAPAVIYDIGGAAGVYAFWLAELGYQVHLLDLTPKHIEEAAARNATVVHRLASLQVGNGCDLPYADASADVVLVMGPLYHLPERVDRVRALQEAYRVVKPEGLLFAAAINRFASLLDGYLSNFVTDPAFVEIVREDIVSGRHRGVGERYFTTSFFHRPEELSAEIQEAGFQEIRVLGVEGLAALIPDLETKWQEAAFRNLALEFIAAIEEEPTLLGLNGHFLAVGKK